MKLFKCSVCKQKRYLMSIYSSKNGKTQCTNCANSMRSASDYTGANPIRDRDRDYQKTKKWWEFWK